jgi:D-serine dehydratase
VLSISDLQSIQALRPLLWINGKRSSLRPGSPVRGMSIEDVMQADERLRRFGGLLSELFPELEVRGGIIESPLVPATELQAAIMPSEQESGRWLLKCDHELPVAGSIKARGGIYEVLAHAERLALAHGVLQSDEDRRELGGSRARALFAQHDIAVGSTGNLGLSVGVMAAALGFSATVHMSAEAKAWKKAHLRTRGVTVVEHTGDFGAAVAAGRLSSLSDPRVYFIDDERSPLLFLGYSVAALRLKEQLDTLAIVVDEHHPLFVYLPCGVGGAPSGITFGLRQVFGDAAHCFFAEPVAAPCFLLRMALERTGPISVRDFGLDNQTVADGLAVAQASEFAAPLMETLFSGVFTASDDCLLADLYRGQQALGIRIEPSAAAGFRGPVWLLQSDSGREYLRRHGLSECSRGATHVLWSTGGALIPESEYRAYCERGRTLVAGRS